MKTKVLNIKTRVIVDAGLIITEYLIDEAILNNKANKGRDIEKGWTMLSASTDCNGTPMPPIPKGEYGEWLCNGTSWVWVPAT